MRLGITGADGFVGRALCDALKASDRALSVRLFDLRFKHQPEFPSVEIDLRHPDAASLVAADVDCVIHLAAIPGAAAERNPAGSARLNLQFSLSLIEELRGKRLVYASSIAVFGDTFPPPGELQAEARPASVYGTHKRMVELAFADAIRRGTLSGYALRLPGVVARKEPDAAFGSSFLSEIFRQAFAAGEVTVPVSSSATSWLCSATTCARNLLVAALADDSSETPLVLPAVATEIGRLVAALGDFGGTARYRYVSDPHLERAFASHPPIDNRRAEAAGLVSDGDVAGLVRNVLARLEIPQLSASG